MRCLIKTKLSEHKSKTPEGYLICKDAVLARTGGQDYYKSEIYPGCEDGDTVITVDRKPEEVFADATIASFENKPLTYEHPDENVTPENYKEYSVGFVRDVRKSSYEGQDVIIGNLVVTDPEAIRAIEDGSMTELSCGYDCDITEGDHPEQINIRGNHVALCEQGRAGIAKIIDNKTVKDAYLTVLKENGRYVDKYDIYNEYESAKSKPDASTLRFATPEEGKKYLTKKFGGHSDIVEENYDFELEENSDYDITSIYVVKAEVGDFKTVNFTPYKHWGAGETLQVEFTFYDENNNIYKWNTSSFGDYEKIKNKDLSDYVNHTIKFKVNKVYTYKDGHKLYIIKNVKIVGTNDSIKDGNYTKQIEEEKQAIFSYKQAIHYARLKGDEKAVELLTHILHEEEEHLKELEKENNIVKKGNLLMKNPNYNQKFTVGQIFLGNRDSKWKIVDIEDGMITFYINDKPIDNKYDFNTVNKLIEYGKLRLYNKKTNDYKLVKDENIFKIYKNGTHVFSTDDESCLNEYLNDSIKDYDETYYKKSSKQLKKKLKKFDEEDYDLADSDKDIDLNEKPVEGSSKEKDYYIAKIKNDIKKGINKTIQNNEYEIKKIKRKENGEVI